MAGPTKADLLKKIEELEQDNADLVYAGLMVHDENVDLLERIDALEALHDDNRESLLRAFRRAEAAEARVAELEEKHLLPMTVDGTDAFETTAGETGVPIVKAEISGEDEHNAWVAPEAPPKVWPVNDGVQ